MTKAYRVLPSTPTGYPLADKFAVIVPEATTNLITNPSFERGTTGYTALASVLARVSGLDILERSYQRRGAYGCSVTPSSAGAIGGIYWSHALTSGVTYTWSADFRGVEGRNYALVVADASAVLSTGGRWIGIRTIPTYSGNINFNDTVAVNRFRACGNWQRLHLTFTAPDTATYRLYLIKTDLTSVSIFVTDGWQLEQKAYPTTYCDGDQRGFLRNDTPYLWTGTPHASTSTRSAATRAGGKVETFEDRYIAVMGYTGLDYVPIENRAIALSQGGELYDTSIDGTRPFAIATSIQRSTFRHLRDMESELLALLRQQTPRKQPLVVRILPHDGCNALRCSPVEIQALYESGLEGQTNNLHGSGSVVNFSAFNPYILEEGNAGNVIDFSQNVNDADRIIQRSAEGNWQALDSGMNGEVRAVARHPDGSVYAVGAFTTAGGGAANRVARWDGSSWFALGTGLNGAGYAIAIDAAGNVYVGGDFTTAGGGGANRIAKWDGSSWAALGTGMNGIVYDIEIANDGGIYAVGAFTTAGGGAANRIARWNGSAWSALGTGLNDVTTCITESRGGLLYVGGAFTTAGGGSASRIAKWNGSAWSALGAGVNDQVEDIAIAADGTIYVGGNFTQAGGQVITYIAKWNGTTWLPLGTGATGPVYTLFSDNNGVLYAGGAFSAAGSIPNTSRLARWNGYAWFPADVTLPSGPTVYDGYYGQDGTIVLGYNQAGTATAAATTVVVNQGTVPARPYRFDLIGPGTLVELVNVTSNKSIYFDLVIVAGERVTLNLSRGRIAFSSNVRPNLLNTILPGSQTSEWELLPGDNIIKLYVVSGTPADNPTMEWRVPFNALADTVV